MTALNRTVSTRSVSAHHSLLSRLGVVSLNQVVDGPRALGNVTQSSLLSSLSNRRMFSQVLTFSRCVIGSLINQCRSFRCTDDNSDTLECSVQSEEDLFCGRIRRNGVICSEMTRTLLSRALGRTERSRRCMMIFCPLQEYASV